MSFNVFKPNAIDNFVLFYAGNRSVNVKKNVKEKENANGNVSEKEKENVSANVNGKERGNVKESEKEGITFEFQRNR